MRLKLVFFLSLLIMLFTSMSAIAAPSTYFETFNTDTGGFHFGYGPQYTDGQVTWAANGGNPAGNISGVAHDLYAIWIYRSDVSSDFDDMSGLTMSIDTKVTGTVSGVAQFYIGRAGTYFISNGSFDVANDTNWTTHSVVLNASNLTEWSGNNINHPLSFVLENPDDIGIFFGGLTATGTGVLHVDNFGIPQPIPTLNEWGLIFFVLLAGFIAIRQIRRQEVQVDR